MRDMLTDAYVTADDYRNGIKPQKTDVSDDTEIDKDLLAVCRYVEKETGREFGQDEENVERKYYGKGGRFLYVDDLVTADAVLIDANGDGTPETELVVDTNFQLFPMNALVRAEAEPYTSLYIPQWASGQWSPQQLVSISGIWGWPAIPDTVKRAVIQLTALLRLETPRASRQINDVGTVVGMSYQAQGIVDELIKNYRKVTF